MRALMNAEASAAHFDYIFPIWSEFHTVDRLPEGQYPTARDADIDTLSAFLPRFS